MNPAQGVQRVWDAFEVYVEGWTTRVEIDEQVRKVGDQYVV